MSKGVEQVFFAAVAAQSHFIRVNFYSFLQSTFLQVYEQ